MPRFCACFLLAALCCSVLAAACAQGAEASSQKVLFRGQELDWQQGLEAMAAALKAQDKPDILRALVGLNVYGKDLAGTDVILDVRRIYYGIKDADMPQSRVMLQPEEHLNLTIKCCCLSLARTCDEKLWVELHADAGKSRNIGLKQHLAELDARDAARRKYAERQKMGAEAQDEPQERRVMFRGEFLEWERGLQTMAAALKGDDKEAVLEALVKLGIYRDRLAGGPIMKDVAKIYYETGPIAATQEERNLEKERNFHIKAQCLHLAHSCDQALWAELKADAAKSPQERLRGVVSKIEEEARQLAAEQRKVELALGRLTEDETIEVAALLLKSHDSGVRIACIQALGNAVRSLDEAHLRKIVDQMTGMWEGEKSHGVKMEVVHLMNFAAGSLRSQEAVAFLRRVASSPTEAQQVRSLAEAGLQSVQDGPAPAGEPPKM